MARKGKEVSIRPKELLIESIELLPSELPEVAIRVVCGKGTYIRALARDIGERLGCGAHLTALRRTKVGDIAVEQCETAERLLERLRTEELAMIAEE